MAMELRVPEVGESITEVEIGAWLVSEGQHVERDQPVVEIESEKATIELPAPASGRVSRIVKQSGESAAVGDVIGYLEEVKADASAVSPAASVPASKAPAPASVNEPAVAPTAKAPTAPDAASPKPAPSDRGSREPDASLKPAPPSVAKEPVPPAPMPKPSVPVRSLVGAQSARGEQADGDARVMPAARRLIVETGVDPADVQGTGPGGRILKEDVQRFVEERVRAGGAARLPRHEPREERVVRMTPMRRTIAARLLSAQRDAALLTTFNEVDMTAVKSMRADLQEEFQSRHGVKLGFMSFFVKACVHALQQCPEINARGDGDDIVYHSYCDIGIAVGSGKGLVVPVLRNAERLSFAQIESTISDFAARAQANKIRIEELAGGTFTISNGGVYGSLLSTPIINPPQSGVLGMHAIQDRPVALDGQVVIRPMMYVALTYDHRIVDGREAVTFLRNVKARIEKPILLVDF